MDVEGIEWPLFFDVRLYVEEKKDSKYGFEFITQEYRDLYEKFQESEHSKSGSYPSTDGPSALTSMLYWSNHIGDQQTMPNGVDFLYDWK